MYKNPNWDQKPIVESLPDIVIQATVFYQSTLSIVAQENQQNVSQLLLSLCAIFYMSTQLYISRLFVLIPGACDVTMPSCWCCIDVG